MKRKNVHDFRCIVSRVTILCDNTRKRNRLFLHKTQNGRRKYATLLANVVIMNFNQSQPVYLFRRLRKLKTVKVQDQEAEEILRKLKTTPMNLAVHTIASSRGTEIPNFKVWQPTELQSPEFWTIRGFKILLDNPVQLPKFGIYLPRYSGVLISSPNFRETVRQWKQQEKKPC